MIISNTADLRKYITVNSTFDFPTFAPYIGKAINSYILKYVGKLHVELADAESGDDSVRNEAREHLRAAIANFAFFMYQPFFQIQMDSSGLSVVNNEQRKQPEWWQINDLRRELLRSGHESMDLLMEVLEQNPDEFTDYHENYSSIYKELLVKNAEEFSKHYTIYNSRQTYLALVPSLRQVEDQYLKNFITKDFRESLKSNDIDDDNLSEIKDYLQKAIVSFTIAKIYNEGTFNFDASGVKLKFDVLPNEKVQVVDYGKPAEQLQRAIKTQIENGTQYMLLAKDSIQEHFPDGLITRTSNVTATIGNAGVIGI